jgi:transcriptional regulator with XRE-family HTH domain
MKPSDKHWVPQRDHAEPDARVIAFGHALLATRRHRRLSQVALERRSGIDQTMISRIERGLVPNTPLRRLVMLADGLDAALGFVERPSR